MAAASYSLTLHNLSPDATAAGLAYPDTQLPTVTVAQLRDLLTSLGGVASQLTIYEPSTPEIRVKTDREIFVIRTRYRRLCFVGWETVLRGEDHSVGFIVATITGTAETARFTPKVIERYVPAPSTTTPTSMPGGVPRWAKVAVMAVLILGLNGFTAYMLLRPVPSMVPKHELLPDADSRALLARVAGDYETGTQEGDRRISINADGTLRLAKLSAQRSPVEERIKTARGALVDGRAALVTADGVVVLKDADTVVFFGNTYRRHGS